VEKFRITIASLPDRERLVAEIVYEGVQWAEISDEEEGVLIVQFYPHPTKRNWEFPCDEAIRVLEKARDRLREF
jgi:hypothetical protein